MSRIGKKPILLSSSVTVNFDSKTRLFTTKSSSGELSCTVHSSVILEMTPKEITVSVKKPEDKFQRSIWGTTRSILQNMVDGVSKGFSNSLELNGVGYKMELSNELVLYIGFSHPVKIVIPSNIKLKLEKNVLQGTSIDKQLLNNFFSYVHNLKPCDPYKQKGFKLPGASYLKKEGKKGKAK